MQYVPRPEEMSKNRWTRDRRSKAAYKNKKYEKTDTDKYVEVVLKKLGGVV